MAHQIGNSLPGMTGLNSPTRSRTPSLTGSPDICSLQQRVDDLYEFLQSHGFLMKKLQQDFAKLKFRVGERSPSPKQTSPESDQKPPKLDDRNLKLDDYTGLGSAEDYLEWERQVDKIADYKSLDDQQTFKVAYIRLTKNVGLSFEGVRAHRKRADKPKINT